MSRLLTITIITAQLAFGSTGLWAQSDRKVANGKSSDRSTTHQDDPISMGKPLSYWISVIRNRDNEGYERAFEAIFELGPKASPAVPELTAIIDAPFEPVRIGQDSPQEIRGKLIDIHIRAGAIDSLGSIGAAAASSAEPAIRWGLTARVIAPDAESARNRLYIELVGVDVIERMRVAGVIARFGVGGAGAIQKLLDSPDGEKHKFAAAILNEAAVTIATELMQSPRCEQRRTGLSLLTGMWPVVSRDHLSMLHNALGCAENEATVPPEKTFSAIGPGV